MPSAILLPRLKADVLPENVVFVVLDIVDLDTVVNFIGGDVSVVGFDIVVECDVRVIKVFFEDESDVAVVDRDVANVAAVDVVSVIDEAIANVVIDVSSLAVVVAGLDVYSVYVGVAVIDVLSVDVAVDVRMFDVYVFNVITDDISLNAAVVVTVVDAAPVYNNLIVVEANVVGVAVTELDFADDSFVESAFDMVDFEGMSNFVSVVTISVVNIVSVVDPSVVSGSGTSEEE